MSHPLYQTPEPAPTATSAEAPKPKGVPLRLPGILERPYLTYALLIINIGIYALKYLAPDFYFEHLLYGGVSYRQGIVHNNEFYRLVTAMFLHANESHIFFNMVSLYSIGSYVERYFGHMRFALIYLLGGLLGGLMMVFVAEVGLGASGAIFAIFGAQIVFLYRQRELFGAAGRAQMWSSIQVMALNFVLGFIANLSSELLGNNIIIGNAAHIGGAVGGAILAWFIAPHFVIKRKAIINPLEYEVSITIEQTNQLKLQIIPLLVYLIGLGAILLFALNSLA